MDKGYMREARERTVPYHSACKDVYFFGNSIAGASGGPEGEWTFLIGPDYTSPNYISSERIGLLCDGTRLEPDLQMKRLRGTGVFFGCAEADGVRVAVWDFAPPEEEAVVRWIRTEDMRGGGRELRVCARIAPFEAETEMIEGGVRIRKDTSKYCFGNRETLNWAERCCQIGFENGDCVQEADGTYVLSAPVGADGGCMLVHRVSYGPAEARIDGEAEALLASTLDYWKKWFEAGKMPRIGNRRAADALESLLLSVKMQQNRDGGAIAGIRKYANSYIRDTHGGMRLLLATGHYPEVARLLRNVHTRWEKSGFIPNWWSMGSDSFIGHSFHNDAEEVTAYYLFMARDYLKHTEDVRLLAEIMPSLRWAAQAQMDWLRAHDYTMDFNGDETEQYCCNHDGEEYGGFVDAEYAWDNAALSFPSMAAALCSLEWFGQITGEDCCQELERLKEKIDEVFLDPQAGVHVWNARPEAGGWRRHRGMLTNYLLLPMWIGARLNGGGEITDARETKKFVRETGFLPNCPQTMQGFCGHTMGLYLYDMLALGEMQEAGRAVDTILDSQLLSMYGTVSEFYGPGCVPNGHMCRAFEGGILGEALVKYFEMES